MKTKQILKITAQILIGTVIIALNRKVAEHYQLNLFTSGFFTCMLIDIIWDIAYYRQVNTIFIGKDSNGKKLYVGDCAKRDDGVIGSFSICDFQLCFNYKEVQENGAVTSFINHGYSYTKI